MFSLGRVTFWCILALLWRLALLQAAPTPSPEKLRALYGSLDKRSVAERLALYQLYPATPEGQRALREALQLLSPNGLSPTTPTVCVSLPTRAIEAIVALVNKQPLDRLPELSTNELTLISKLAAHLPNRRLKGNQARTEDEVIKLPPEQVDLARGLFLSDLGNSPEAEQTLNTYEAMMDLMALQILARIDLQSTPQQKVRELNRFVFETMNFRFPPHSQFEQDIHIYTFLPSVLDSRRGVCLGVSILYACLAQRLNLPLELITPPGHIFVRYKDGSTEINVETTMRGVHVDSDEYLGADIRKLQQRNIKETIGLAHINEASVFFTQGEYQSALKAYQKAEKYLPNDPLLQELMGYTYLLLGKEDQAWALLQPLTHYVSPYTVGKNTLLHDVLEGHADARCLATLFAAHDETAVSLMKKRDDIEAILKDHPNFRTGWLHLGTTHLSLHKVNDAIRAFEAYHLLDDENAHVEFTLSVLHAQRLHHPKAWEHLQRAEKLAAKDNHDPDCLHELRKQLAIRCPE